MDITIFLIIGLLFITLLAGVYFLAVRSGKKLRAGIKDTYGPRLKLVSGCGVISGYNRVPGVLGLLDDRIIFRAMITGENGEILFQNIQGWLMENTASSRYQRARKYRSARVLALETTDGKTRLFVLSEKSAPKWEQHLSILGPATNPSQVADGR